VKKLLPNIALLLGGIVAGLALAEGISRLVYKGPWQERLGKEQLQDRQWKREVRLNALGLRGRDYSATKPPHTKRVLILGDSFTFGSGLSDDSVVFPALLQKRLCADFAPRGMAIEVLNGGMTGSLTGDWVQLLEQVKDSFQPDVILVVFFLRDGTRLHLLRSFVWPIRDQIVARNRASVLYRQSYLFRLIRDYRDRLEIAEHYGQGMNDAYFGSARQTQEWTIAQANIRKIKETAAEIHARVGLVVFPALVQLDQHYPFKKICDLITEFGVRNQIPTHNLLPAFLGKNAPDLWVSPANQHPNARGHEIAASSILPFLRQLLTD